MLNPVIGANKRFGIIRIEKNDNRIINIFTQQLINKAFSLFKTHTILHPVLPTCFQEFREGMEMVEENVNSVMKEVKHTVSCNCLIKCDASYIDERIVNTEERLESLKELHRQKCKR